jgi:CBS-domain-containing membrane protein
MVLGPESGALRGLVSQADLLAALSRVAYAGNGRTLE